MSFTVIRPLLDPFYIIAGLVLSPLVAYRALRHGRYRRGWGQRFGNITRHSPEKPCIWLHAVSMGEANAARLLIEQVKQHYPDHEIVISTTTDTGFVRAQKLYGESHAVFFFPLDISWTMQRAFKQLKPSLCLLMELEVWPNFLHLAQQQSVPTVVVNGRISDRSIASYRRFRWALRPTFAQIHLALVQTQEYADRFIELGCPAERVRVTGSLKYDAAIPEEPPEQVAALTQRLALQAQPVWVAGGTGDGEEGIILTAFRQLREDHRLDTLRLIVVPRKPERFEDVARQIAEAGFAVQRYSEIKDTHDTPHVAGDAVILGDTMGDLRRFYSLATVVFVGRSLVPLGGSDMMEAAALGKPTLFGPHTDNFRQTVQALLDGGGSVEVREIPSLVATVKRCIVEPDYATRLAEKGRQIIRDHRGATQRTLAAIETLRSTA